MKYEIRYDDDVDEVVGRHRFTVVNSVQSSQNRQTIPDVFILNETCTIFNTLLTRDRRTRNSLPRVQQLVFFVEKKGKAVVD